MTKTKAAPLSRRLARLRSLARIGYRPGDGPLIEHRPTWRDIFPPVQKTVAPDVQPEPLDAQSDGDPTDGD